MYEMNAKSTEVLRLIQMPGTRSALQDRGEEISVATVNLSQINKFYGATQALFDVSLDIEDGAFVVFVGPSGCGKSTLLRAIAGLEGIESGQVRIGADDVTETDPADRGVAMVFPVLRALPAHDGAPEHGIRDEGQQGRPRRTQPPDQWRPRASCN